MVSCSPIMLLNEKGAFRRPIRIDDDPAVAAVSG